jgi:hypothetical protein
MFFSSWCFNIHKEIGMGPEFFFLKLHSMGLLNISNACSEFLLKQESNLEVIANFRKK